jgi:hypothetical protein
MCPRDFFYETTICVDKRLKKKSYPILNEETEIKNNEKEDMGQTV